jgi:hypothetical protein
MGTITRTFANNITTSGVFKPTAFNNASFDNVTSVPEGAVEGGNMVLLSTQTASASASISFTTGIDSTYKEYMFIFNNIHPASDGQPFTVNFRDGSSAFDATKTTTVFNVYHNENDSATNLGYRTDNDIAQGTGYQSLAHSVGADADQSVSGTMHLFDPSNTTFVKHFLATTFNAHSSDIAYEQFTAGYCNVTVAIDGVDFKFASGNIDAGTIQMFGIL